MTSPSRTLRRAEARRHAKTGARLAGCICRPNFRHIANGHLVVAHDQWCPAVDAAPQIVAFYPTGCNR